LRYYRHSSDSIKPYAFTQQSRKLLLGFSFQRFNSEVMGLVKSALPVHTIHRLSENLNFDRLRHRLWLNY